MELILPRSELRERVAALVTGIETQVWTERTTFVPARTLLCLPHPPQPWQLTALGQADGLLGLQVLSSGVDHLRGQVPAGTPVFRAPHLRGTATAEVAVALTLMSILDAPQWGRVHASGSWSWLPPTGRLQGRQVLVLGRGDVGAAVAQVMRALGAEVTALGRDLGDRGPAALPEVLPGADVVVLALPLTARTVGLFDHEMLRLLKPGALLVNVARGGLVDTHALVAQLMQGRIRAALDVVDPEPLPAGHPLWACPNLVLSPHVGGGVTIDDDTLAAFVAEQATALAAGGEPRFRVAREYYDW